MQTVKRIEVGCACVTEGGGQEGMRVEARGRGGRREKEIVRGGGRGERGTRDRVYCHCRHGARAVG